MSRSRAYFAIPRTLLPLALAAACGSSSDPPGLDATGDPPPVDAGVPDAGAPIEPDDPGPSDLRIDIDTTTDRRAISPWIYGSNGADFSGWASHLTLTRSGGNRLTAYNWENNASNAGTDWFNQNDGYLSESDVAGEAIRPFVAGAHAAGAAALVTIPICGYVAADKGPGGDVNMSGPDYLDTRFHPTIASKGAPFTYPPDVNDGAVYQDEFVAWLEGEFASPGAPPIFYSLDNEPDLWSSTHPRIHPNPVGYDELAAKNIDFASAIKDAAPGATVFGPVNYGFNGYVSLQDAPDAAGRDFLDFWLDEMAAAEAAQGRRVVDVMDLHWYPEVYVGASGIRITADDESPEVAEARAQAARSFWDPTYDEGSWISMYFTFGPIRLIPMMMEKIAAHYPGTLLSFSEYYYGGGGHISGALAQAEILGAFGREGVFAATLWPLGSSTDELIHAAFDAYRDYDGAGGAFGAVSVPAISSNLDAASAWASIDTTPADRVIVVLVNRAAVDQDAGIAVRHTALLSGADVHVLQGSSPTLTTATPINLTLRNAFVYTMPAQSVTTLVLHP